MSPRKLKEEQSNVRFHPTFGGLSGWGAIAPQALKKADLFDPHHQHPRRLNYTDGQRQEIADRSSHR
jgi:hypothetical protein